MPQQPSDQGRPEPGTAGDPDVPGLTCDGGRQIFPEDEDWVPPPEPYDPEADGWCPDPDSGPPGGDAAWLAYLAAAQLDALARESAAAQPTGREAIGAGFTHRAEAAAGWAPARLGAWPAGPAMGFEAGGPLDLAPPGPVLAALAQDVMDDGLAALSDDQLVGLLTAARRMTSWQAAAELRVAAELDARRHRDAAADRAARGQAADGTGRRAETTSSTVIEHVSAELAAALTLTGRSADVLLELARELTRLGPVLAALTAGVIDLPKARVFADELANADDPTANRIALRYLDRASGWTTSQLRRALRAAVLAHDPAAGRKRAASARADTRVETWEEGSGNAALSGRELPPAEAIAADQRISEIARALKNKGAAGTMDQLRAGVYLALLLGTDPATVLLGDPAAAASGGPAGLVGAGLGLADPPVGAAGLAGTIHLTLPALTWLGLADQPGELSGLGPQDPATCRDLADMMGRAGPASWHVTLTDPDGRALAHACPSGPPPASRTSSGTAGRPPSTGPPGTAGPPSSPSPPGSIGPPSSTGPPGSTRPPDTSGDPRLTWLAGLTFDWLERGTCQHRRQTSAYQPGKALRHLLAIRNPTCTYPGCRRPARHCDNEHTIPYDQGGKTCECNCGPVCRKHHRVKQAPGWHLVQDHPGTFTWTTPAGRSYTTHPDAYTI